MNHLPDGIAGKILALGFCFALVAAIFLVVVAPLARVYDDGAQRLEQKQALLQRQQALVRDLPRLREAASHQDATDTEGELLLAGSGDTVAAANLQSAVKELVENGGASLTTAEILPPETKQNYRQIGIRVSFSGDLTVLTSILRGVETAHPIMVIDNLDIRGTGGGNTAQALTVALDVFGYRATGAQ